MMRRTFLRFLTCLVGALGIMALYGSETVEDVAPTIRLDTRTGTRYARAEEPIVFSTDWNEGTTRLVLKVDDENVLTATTSTNGVYTWRPDLSTSGTVTLTHTTRGTVNEVLTATFSIMAYTVVFQPGAHGSLGSDVPTTQRVPKNEAAVLPNVMPSPGYRFTGWSVNTSKVTRDLTATAQYGAITYRIVYEDVKGATHANPSSYTIENALTFRVPSSIPEGWRFVRWEPSSIAVGTTGDKMVRAVWERIHFDVEFNSGAHGSLASGAVATQNVAYGESAVLPEVVPQKGYRFTGWSSDASNVTSNITVTAKYETIPYAITYENLQGATHTNPTTYTVEDSVVFSAPSSLPRRKFIRWDPESIAVGTTGPLTVRAVWEVTPFVFVDAAHGNDTNCGNESGQSVKSLSKAYALAEAGDVIFVGAGKYGPVTVTGKAVEFRAPDGAIIDGAGTNRCVTADEDVVFENFTIQNGHDAEKGGGVKGGTFNRCTIRNCYSGWDGGGAYEAILWNSLIVGNTAENGWGGVRTAVRSSTVRW